MSSSLQYLLLSDKNRNSLTRVLRFLSFCATISVLHTFKESYMPIIIHSVPDVVREALEESFGLPPYARTLTLRGTNVATDKAYQKNFTSFYRVRRDAAWLDVYYAYMEAHKNDGKLTINAVLDTLYTTPHKAKSGMIHSIELSFSSKLLATICPDKYPIWDSRVVKAMGIKTGITTIPQAVEAYEAFREEILTFIATTKGKACMTMFDRLFPNYTWVSDLKKMDFYLWHMGK